MPFVEKKILFVAETDKHRVDSMLLTAKDHPTCQMISENIMYFPESKVRIMFALSSNKRMRHLRFDDGNYKAREVFSECFMNEL